MSNYNPQGGGLQYRGTIAVAPPNCSFEERDPTPYDRSGYSLLDLWLNTVTNDAFILVSLKGTSTSKGTLALWIKISIGTVGVFTLTGNDDVAISPDGSGNINIKGAGPITVTGDQPSFTETISINSIITTPYTTPGPFTWMKNDNTKKVIIIGWSGGAGGGSGGTGASQLGGGGGGAGGSFYYDIPATFLSGSVSGVVGAGGAGGASVSGVDAVGNIGSNGIPSSFGNFTTQIAGGGAGAPTPPQSSAGGASGSVSTVGNFTLGLQNSPTNPPTSGGNSGFITGNGISAGAVKFGNMLPSAGGGGSSGSSIVAGNGGDITNIATAAVIVAGGIAPSGDGNDGSTATNFMCGGTGGAGGNSISVTGGNGGFPGGGGGGGAGNSGAGPSGAGGNGGDGMVLIIEYLS